MYVHINRETKTNNKNKTHLNIIECTLAKNTLILLAFNI